MPEALPRQPVPPPLPLTELRLADSVEEMLWFGDEDADRTQDQASASLAAAVAEATGLKPFPAAAAQLIRVLANPNYKMEAVEKIVRQDPAFTAKLLRVANSPMFRRGAPCDSVESAVVRMGARNVLEAVAAVASMSMFEDLDGYGVRVRNHCIAVASISRVIADFWGFHGGGLLALCGLLHDIGKLLTAQCGEIAYQELPEEVLASVDQVHITERKLTGYDHAVLGAHVLSRWGIPEPVPQVVGWHHQPVRAYEHGGDIGTMVAMLRLADHVETAIHNSRDLTDDALASLMADGCAEFLEINAADLRGMWPALLTAHTEAALA